MCMWVVTSECRISDSDRARAVMISAARSSSPRPSPQPSGRRRTGPSMGSDYDRTRVLEVIPNTWYRTRQDAIQRVWGKGFGTLHGVKGVQVAHTARATDSAHALRHRCREDRLAA